MDRIAIHSAPRSGSTWLGSIFDSQPEVLYKMQPLFSYAMKGRLSPSSDEEEINLFFTDLKRTSDDFMDQVEGKKKGIIPDFAKMTPRTIVYKEVRYHHILENLLAKDSNIKVVGLIRNPLSVISSWLKAPKEFKKELGWKPEEEWRFAPKKNLNKPEEFNGFEKWKELTKLFFQLNEKYKDRFYLISYDDLLKNTQSEVTRLFEFCDLEVTQQTEQFINAASTRNNKDAYSVYKVKYKDDSWKNDLPKYIIDEITEDKYFRKCNEIFRWV